MVNRKGAYLYTIGDLTLEPHPVMREYVNFSDRKICLNKQQQQKNICR